MHAHSRTSCALPCATCSEFHRTGHFRQTLPVNPDAVRAVMLTHSTQPSEPARCAPFYPSSYCCNNDPALLDPPSQAA